MGFLVIFFTGCVVCAPSVSMATTGCAPASAGCQETYADATVAPVMLQTRRSHNNHEDMKNGASMPFSVDAQKGSHRQNRWWGGRRRRKMTTRPTTTTTTTCCNMYLNGKDRVSISRTLSDSFPREMLVVIPTTGTGITVNTTHVFFPSHQTIRGTFVRSTHAMGSYEYGDSQQRWGENAMSAFPDIAGGVAEKLRVFHHEGGWPTTSLDRVRDIQASRWTITDKTAKIMNRLRIYKQFMYLQASKFGPTLINSTIDMTHVAEMQDFAFSNNGQPSAFMQERKNQLSQNLTRQRSLAEGDPSSVGVNCMHFQRRTDVLANSDGVYLPLDKKQVSFRGNMVFSPLRRVDFASGITTVSYDETSKEVMIHMSSSSLGELNEPEQQEANAAYYRSAVDGESNTGSIPEDARIQSNGASTAVYALYKVANADPVDYTYLYQNESEICPPEKFDMLKKEAAGLDLMDVKTGKAGFMEKQNLIFHLIDVLDCGISFVRGVPAMSNGVGLLEMMGWAHFLMEAPPAHRLENVFGWD